MPALKVRVNGQWVAISGGSVDTTEIINTAVGQSNEYTDRMKQEINVDISEISESLNGTKDYIDGAFRDGILTSIEKSRIRSYLNELAVDKARYDQDYQAIHDNPDLSTEDQGSLEAAYNQYDDDYTALVDYINGLLTKDEVSQEELDTVDQKFIDLKNSVNLLAASLQAGLDDIAQKKANDALLGANGYTDDQLSPVVQRVSTVETSVVQITGELSSKISQDDYEVDMSALNESLSGLRQDLDETDQYIDGAFHDGIITEAEGRKIESYLKTLNSSQASIEQRYTQAHDDPVTSDTDVTNMETAKTGYDEAYNKIVADITSVIEDNKASEEENTLINTDFDEYRDALSLLTQMIEIALKNNALAKADNARDEAEAYADELKQQTDQNLGDVNQSISDTRTYVDGAFKDGLISSTEAKRISTYLNSLATEKSGFDKEYNTVYNDSQLSGGVKDSLASAYTNFTSAYDTLTDTISTIFDSGYASSTDLTQVNTNFSTYQDAAGNLSDVLTVAINFISQVKADEALQGAKEYTDNQLGDYVQATLYQQDMEEIRNQLDGQVSNWFFDYDPTLDNAPADGWTTTADKDDHIGDYFLNNSTGQAFRFTKDGSVYTWVAITDNAIADALQMAQLAKDTADHKRRVFTEQPTTPYDVGDLWVDDTDDPNNPIIKECITAKVQSGSFSSADFRPVGDMTALNKAYDTMRLAGEDAGTIVTRLGNTESNVVQLTNEVSAKVSQTSYNQNIGADKWILKRYPMPDGYLSTTVPDYSTISGVSPTEESLVSDGATLFNSTDDYAIIYLKSAVYVSAAHTLEFTFEHDDSCRIYVNGISVYDQTGTSSAAGGPQTVSASLNQGWNTIEFLLNASGAPNAVDSITPTIGSQVDKMSCYYADSIGRLTMTEAELSIQAGEISNKVSSTDYNGQVIISKVNQTADTYKIQAKNIDLQGAITISSFDSDTLSRIDNNNVEIGGTNLLRDSRTWGPNSGIAGAADRGDGFYEKGVSDSDEAVINTVHIPVSAGQEITVGIDIRATTPGQGRNGNTEGASSLIAQFYTSESGSGATNRFKYKWIDMSSFYLDEEYSRFFFTITVPDNYPTCWFALGLRGQTVYGTTYFSKCKIEEGNKATTWSEAPEDNEAYADQVAQAKAELAETQAKAYADGQVSAEEFRAIQDAQNKYNSAVSHANSVANSAEDNAKSYADTQYSSTKSLVNSWKGEAISGKTYINGGLIQTNTLTAEKIAVGDFTNYCVNPNFDGNDASGWTNLYWHGGVADAPTQYVGEQKVRDNYGSGWFPVKAGDKFYVQMDCYGFNENGAYQFGIGLNTQNISGSNQYPIAVRQSPDNQWHTISGTLTIPEGHVRARVFLQINGTSNFNRWRFTNVIVRRVSGTIMSYGSDGSYTEINGGNITSEGHEWDYVFDQEGYSKLSLGGTLFKVEYGGINTEGTKDPSGRLEVKTAGVYIGQEDNYGIFINSLGIGFGDFVEGPNSEWSLYEIDFGSLSVYGRERLTLETPTYLDLVSGGSWKIGINPDRVWLGNGKEVKAMDSNFYGDRWVGANNIRFGYHTFEVADGRGIGFRNPNSGYVNVDVNNLTERSSYDLKQDFIKPDSAYLLNLINQTDVVQFKFKSDLKNGIDHTLTGFVIGGGYYTPKEFISYDGGGVSTYSITGVLTGAVQQLSKLHEQDRLIIDQLKEDKESLLLKLSGLESRLISVEEKLNGVN